MREERAKPTPTENGKTDVRARTERYEHQSDTRPHQHLLFCSEPIIQLNVTADDSASPMTKQVLSTVGGRIRVLRDCASVNILPRHERLL